MSEGDASAVFADEEAAMKKGKGVALVAWGVVVIGLLVGLFLLMGGDDDRRVHRELGRKINRVKLEGFDRFWGCALREENLKAIKSNTDLSYQVLRRAAEIGQPYAQHLLDDCMFMLKDIEPELDVLIVHDAALKGHVSEMSTAIGDMRAGLRGLISYLDQDELEYDEAIAEEHVKKVSRGWYEFRKASGAANQLLKKKLSL